jgi:hypothetical protein
MSLSETLTSQGWRRARVDPSSSEAIEYIQANPAAFQTLLEAAMESKERDELVVNFLVNCFPLPAPITRAGVSTKRKEGGYQNLTWTTLEYQQCPTGWPQAIVDLKELALFGAVTILGRPTELKQFITITASQDVAREVWHHDTVVDVGAEVEPIGVIVARWENEDVWYVSKPIYDSQGRIVGYDYRLLYRNPHWVQEATKGVFFDLKENRAWDRQGKLRSDFPLSSYAEWLQADGPYAFFNSKVFENTGKRRATALISGPSGGGKTAFIRSLLAEVAKEFVIFRVTPSEFLRFQYPTFLKNLFIWVEDCEEIIPPRGSGKISPTEEVLAKLEFNPALSSSDSGTLEAFGLIFTANKLGSIDHAALQNRGRFDEIFFLEPGSWLDLGPERLATVINGKGSVQKPISEVIHQLEECIPESIRKN